MQNVYLGNKKPMLVPACIFREGGAGLILTNKWEHRFLAKYAIPPADVSSMVAREVQHVHVIHL